MSGTAQHDVAIVGASLAGCATATLLARQGLSVALIDKHAGPGAYKRLCGHYIQPSATPVLRRLGLVESIERAGGVRNGVDVWTRWGWITPRPEPGTERPYGYNIRRAKLDPMVRELAAGATGVSYLPGQAATALAGGARDGQVGGVVVRDTAGRERRIRARLVVGADGRGSAVAPLAGAHARRSRNERFCYMAYYAGVDLRAEGRGRLWALEPDVVIAAPNDEGLTLIAVFPHKARLPAFRADLERAFTELVTSTPAAPDLASAERVSKFVGYRDYPVLARPLLPRPGVALVGDAALTMDPVWAIGCGWALQSAEWLADAVGPALAGAEPVERGLRRYRTWHRRRLSGHVRLLAGAAKAGATSPVERLMLSAATRDDEIARHFERFAGRMIPVRRFLAPAALARAGRANLRAREATAAVAVAVGAAPR